MAKIKSTSSSPKESNDTNSQQSLTERNRLKSWHFILGLGVLCIAFYYRVIFGSAHFWEDLIYQEFPHRIFARDCLLHFQFPHWNPYTFNGMPFFAAIHTGVLYPFNLLISLLPFSMNLFWYVLECMIISHIFFAGVCMFLYIRHKKFSNEAAFLGAVSYMLCGFFITHIIHSLIIYILAWLPLIILLLEKGIKQDKLHYHIIAGLILGITILAGHPQITFYEFLFIGSYSLYFWFFDSERKRVHLAFLGILFTIAVGIACIQLLPTAELGNHSARVDWTFEQASEGSFSFPQLLTFLMPKLFGAWSAPESTAPRFWLPGPKSGYYTYWDTCFYTGLVIFLFGLFQLRNVKKNHFVRFSLIWGIISLAIGLGSFFFVYKILFLYIPGFDRFRSPARILFTWNFLIPILAAATFDQLKEKNVFTKIIRPLFILCGICAVVGVLVLIGFPKIIWPEFLSDENIAKFTSAQGAFLLLNVFLILIPLILAWKNKISIQQTRIIIIVALITDMFIFGLNHHITNKRNAPRFFSESKELAGALQKEGKNEMFRANTRQFRLDDSSQLGNQTGLMLLKRNQGMIDKIQIVEGYNPLNLHRRLPPSKGRSHFNRLLDLLNIRFYVNPDYTDRSMPLILLNHDKLPRAKMFYHYSVFDNDSLVKEFMFTHSFDYKNKLLLSEKPSLSISPNLTDSNPAPGNSIKITKYEANTIEMRVATARNGLLWLSEIWYPAWKAYIDGKETKVLCADYSFRAVEIPKGEHKIKFVYKSGYFTCGALITLLTLLFSIGYLVFVFVRKSREN